MQNQTAKLQQVHSIRLQIQNYGWQSNAIVFSTGQVLFKLWLLSKNINLNLYSIFIFKTCQDFKLLICYFYLNVSSELFHNKVVKQSIALESQDSFGWRIRWWCFNSNGDVDLCPEERTEARLLIPSLTTRLYLSNCFHSQFLQAWCRAIKFFSHYNSSSLLTGCSSNLCCFFPFPSNRKLQLLSHFAKSS